MPLMKLGGGSIMVCCCLSVSGSDRLYLLYKELLKRKHRQAFQQDNIPQQTKETLSGKDKKKKNKAAQSAT